MNTIFIKYLTVILTFLVITIILLIKKYYFKNTITDIFKTYDSILEKKEKYNNKNKELLYVKNIDDLVKISYVLDKKINYVNNNKSILFFLEEKDYTLIHEVAYETSSK